MFARPPQLEKQWIRIGCDPARFDAARPQERRLNSAFSPKSARHRVPELSE